MTSVLLDNRAGTSTQASKHYIRLPTVSISARLGKNLTKYNDPRTAVDAGAETRVKDLHDVERIFTITGYIDKNCEFTDTTYVTALSVAEALLTIDAITNMMKNGGVLKLTIGTTGDGYSITRATDVHITSFTWTEESKDEAVCSCYSFTLECLESADL